LRDGEVDQPDGTRLKKLKEYPGERLRFFYLMAAHLLTEQGRSREEAETASIPIHRSLYHQAGSSRKKFELSEHLACPIAIELSLQSEELRII
jgi:hypothetical protein